MKGKRIMTSGQYVFLPYPLEDSSSPTVVAIEVVGKT